VLETHLSFLDVEDGAIVGLQHLVELISGLLLHGEKDLEGFVAHFVTEHIQSLLLLRTQIVVVSGYHDLHQFSKNKYLLVLEDLIQLHKKFLDHST
jgi:hypothetical protein